MYRGAVQYRGVWLAPGSESLQLFKDGKFKELDQHLKAQDEKRRILEGRT